jgi:uncharacterized protein YcfL
MRNLVCSVAAIAALALVACGASSKEVAMAKTAHYQGDKAQLFAAMRTAVEAKYKVTKADDASLAVQTEAHWYSPEGLSQTPRGEGTEMQDLVDKSINIAMVVAMVPDGNLWVVKVTPVMARFNRGIPKPEPLKEGDASLPGWVESKLDTLALDIHKGLEKWELKSVPQQVPPPTETAPAASGAPAGEGSAPAPAAGSAATP